MIVVEDRLLVASGSEILEGGEEPVETQYQRTAENSDDCAASLLQHCARENDTDDREVEELSEPAVERHVDDQSCCAPPPPPADEEREVSSSRPDESCRVTPGRSSQLSETLRNNLERLLQRGPMLAAASSGRRRTKRDGGKTATDRRQTESSRDHKHSRRHHHHHHRHRHHHHSHHCHHPQQQHQQQDNESYNVDSEMTDIGTVRSLSVTTVSGDSSPSDGMFKNCCCSDFWLRLIADMSPRSILNYFGTGVILCILLVSRGRGTIENITDII